MARGSDDTSAGPQKRRASATSLTAFARILASSKITIRAVCPGLNGRMSTSQEPGQVANAERHDLFGHGTRLGTVDDTNYFTGQET